MAQKKLSKDADLAAAPEPPRAPRKYASPLMADRRRRILSEAQRLLDDGGLEGFTIRALSRRAGVAQRTLYNVFGSKEDIVASAIEQHFTSFLHNLPPRPTRGGLEVTLGLLRAIAHQTISLRRYSTAMVTVFFSPTVDHRIYQSLRHISELRFDHWIDWAEKAQVIVKLTAQARERVLSAVVNAGYSNVADWAAGRIGDGELIVRAQLNFLLLTNPLLRPKHRAQAQAALTRLLAEGG